MTGGFQEVSIRGVTFRPALFCAPMAGITHSAFRRVVASFGGCGGFYTEMLSAKWILREDLQRSPALRRNPQEPRLIYQLMLDGTEPLDRVIGRLSELRPDGLDINLACHAPAIRRQSAGSRLFDDAERLATVLDGVRRNWSGLLTVKIRLGTDTPGWEERFAVRARLFESAGVDAVILHPRFFEEKFKRHARHERLAWAASLTRLPLIANGDIVGPATAAGTPALFAPACGLMVGRMAVMQPWVFGAWEQPITVDRAAVWQRMADAIEEDFEPGQALGRVKIFTEYFARNFRFGHSFYVSVQNGPNLAAVRERAEAFFATSPDIDPAPSLMGL